MTDIAFSWRGVTAEDMSRMNFTSISIVNMLHVNPAEVILWDSFGEGICVRSDMHDIAEREEIGVLEFSWVENPDCDNCRKSIKLPIGPVDKVWVKKLVLEIRGTKIECGIVLGVSNKDNLVILPADYPYALAIRGDYLDFRFVPEYPIERYRRLPLS